MTMQNSTPSLGALAALILLASSLGGCAGLAVGAGATAGTAALQERGFSGAVSDTVLHAKIAASYLNAGVNFKLVSIEVHQGRVLLTGTVPKSADRVDAVRLAWQEDGVTSVINEIAIEDDSDILDLARDKWVTAQLRLKITFDGQIKAINYAIDTVNGTVYLMGIAQSQSEIDRVRNHARGLDYVRRVISHVRIKSAPSSG